MNGLRHVVVKVRKHVSLCNGVLSWIFPKVDKKKTIWFGIYRTIRTKVATAIIRVNLAFSFATLSGEADGDLSVFEIMWTYMPIMEMQGMIIFKKI